MKRSLIWNYYYWEPLKNMFSIQLVPRLFMFWYACGISRQSNMSINCEVSLFQCEKEQHTMPDICCAVGCQNRIEIVSKHS